VLAATALIILTTGLWSLNAKLSRLNFEDRPESTQTPVMIETPAAEAPAARPTGRVSLDDALYLTLTPTAAESTAP
jgi:hypothetical protein